MTANRGPDMAPWPIRDTILRIGKLQVSPDGSTVPVVVPNAFRKQVEKNALRHSLIGGSLRRDPSRLYKLQPWRYWTLLASSSRASGPSRPPPLWTCRASRVGLRLSPPSTRNVPPAPSDPPQPPPALGGLQVPSALPHRASSVSDTACQRNENSKPYGVQHSLGQWVAPVDCQGNHGLQSPKRGLPKYPDHA